MKKYIVRLLWLGLILLLAGLLGNYVFHKKQPLDVEQLRDELKVYQTTPVTKILPAETQSTLRLEEAELPDEEESPEEQEDLLPQIQEPVENEKLPEVSEETEVPETESPVMETEAPETVPEVSQSERIPEATLDFEAMWKTNPDICAWIEISGTKVDYPILQSAEDDEKYLTTAVDGSYYVGGSLFTQASYNARDFNDPVTIIYGHTMWSGTLFGQLQPIYSSASGFEEQREIKLYLPEEVRYYTVFAAVPYESIHILHTYDFSNRYWYRNFFKTVFKIRTLGAQFDETITPEPDDKVIILSTCLNEDPSRRFLVMAVHQEDIE